MLLCYRDFLPRWVWVSHFTFYISWCRSILRCCLCSSWTRSLYSSVYLYIWFCNSMPISCCLEKLSTHSSESAQWTSWDTSSVVFKTSLKKVIARRPTLYRETMPTTVDFTASQWFPTTHSLWLITIFNMYYYFLSGIDRIVQ